MTSVQKERAATFTKQPAHKTTDDAPILLAPHLSVNAAIVAAWQEHGKQLFAQWRKTHRRKHWDAYRRHRDGMQERMAAGVIHV